MSAEIASNSMLEEADDFVQTAQDTPVNEEVQAEPEYTDVQREAIQLGWDPTYQGTEDKPAKTAEQYLSEGEKIGLRKQVREKDNYIKDLEAMIRSIDSRQANLEKDIYEKALRDVEAKRRSAVEVADSDAYDKYNQEYQELQEKKQSIEQSKLPDVSIDDMAEVKSFQARNKDWFNEETPQSLVMSKDAIEIETLLRNKHPDKNTGEILADVENYIKTKYSDHFRSNLRTRSPPLVPNTQNGQAKSKPTLSDLTEAQKKAVSLFKDVDGFDVDSYINELYKSGRIPGFKGV